MSYEWYGYGKGWGRGRGGPPEWAGRGMGWGGRIPALNFKPINPPPPGALRVACGVLENRGIDSMISPRFARAPFMSFTDITSGRIISCIIEPNPAAEASHGAGIAVAQWLISSGVRAVLAARLGPNISSVLQSAGVHIYYVNPGLRLIDALRYVGLVR